LDFRIANLEFKKDVDRGEISRLDIGKEIQMTPYLQGNSFATPENPSAAADIRWDRYLENRNNIRAACSRQRLHSRASSSACSASKIETLGSFSLEAENHRGFRGLDKQMEADSET
jgi:hypothetical protein